MNSSFRSFPHATVAPFVPAGVLRTDALSARLRRLYATTERAPAVFASPHGPVVAQGREYPIPRFVYLSPFGADETLRVAVHAGYDHRDERSTDAVLHVIERLLLSPDLGDGINVTFYPLIDILGNASGESRGLAAESWLDPVSPEIELLARDARQRAFDVFARLEVAPFAHGSSDDLVVVRLRGGLAEDLRHHGDDFLSSADFDPFPVRFELESGPVREGPLTLADDFGRTPIELTLILPDSRTPELYREAVALISKRLILRYRGHQAYGQHI
jgi:hypothetical protein